MQSKRKLISLFFILFAIGAHAQITVRGMVSSAEDQQPLPGVSVVVKGTTKGTVTDIDGNYAIDVQPEDILVLTYVGFVPQDRWTEHYKRHPGIRYIFDGGGDCHGLLQSEKSRTFQFCRHFVF